MRTMFLCVGLGLAVASLALAETEPSLFQPGGGGTPMHPDPDACWSQPPDLKGLLASSEVCTNFHLNTEMAGDFILDTDRTITKVRWWGGYSNDLSAPCDPGMTPPGFTLRFYESNDVDCLPATDMGDAYVEVFVDGAAGETLIGCQEWGDPLYSYETLVNVPLAGSTRYWFSVQMADHGFPPSWGRLTSTTMVGCEAALGNCSLMWHFDCWYPASAVYGVPRDLSQEFECDEPVAVQDRSWGRIKGLYR